MAIHTGNEGTGDLSIYFVLADKNGEMTTSDGRATIEIIDPEAWPLSSQVLFKGSANVSKSDFQKAQLDMGKLADESIIYDMGLINYSQLSKEPSGDIFRLKITFVTSDNRTLEREKEMFWQSPDASIPIEAPHDLRSSPSASEGFFEDFKRLFWQSPDASIPIESPHDIKSSSPLGEGVFEGLPSDIVVNHPSDVIHRGVPGPLPYRGSGD